MKARIFGTIFVLAILVLVALLTGQLEHTGTGSGSVQVQEQPTDSAPMSSADSTMKSLKIN